MNTLAKTNEQLLTYPQKDMSPLERQLEEQILALESKPISGDEGELGSQNNGSQPGKSVVILKAQVNEDQVFQAMKNGAVMFLTRGDAFDVPCNNRSIVNSVSLDSISTPENEEEMPVEPLSPRQTEILAYAAHGIANKKIAVNLNISQQTVKNHMSRIFERLYANDRTHAVVKALRYGWLTI